jgi:hypothetical protein
MKRLLTLLFSISLAMVLLTACLTSRIPAGSLYGDWTHFSVPPDKPFDWIWVSWTEEMADNAIPVFGAGEISARVCFPAMPPGAYPRPYLYINAYGNEVYPSTTDSGCTHWIPVAEVVEVGSGVYDSRSTGWHKMVGAGAGEPFLLQIKLSSNASSTDQDVWTTTWLANGDLTTVWHEF